MSVQTDRSITINAVDLSAFLRTMDLDDGFEAVAGAETDGDTARYSERGMATGALSVQFKQSYAANEVDATISALPATFTVVIKPTSGAVSATNPSRTATMHLVDYQPNTGTIGDIAYCTASFALADGTGWARATA